MDIIISNSNDKPIYIQLKDQIRNAIISGDLLSGEKLPSIRSLAKDLKISVITTKAAYELLEKEGYVKTVPSKGIYVARKNSELIKEEQLKNIEKHVVEAIKIAKISKIEKEEINSIIDIFWEDKNE